MQDSKKEGIFKSNYSLSDCANANDSAHEETLIYFDVYILREKKITRFFPFDVIIQCGCEVSKSLLKTLLLKAGENRNRWNFVARRYRRFRADSHRETGWKLFFAGVRTMGLYRALTRRSLGADRLSWRSFAQESGSVYLNEGGGGALDKLNTRGVTI